MKIIYKTLLMFGILAFIAGCTKDFEEINKNPNNPEVVASAYLFTNAQKALVDDVMDEWFSGRQGLLWAQYWSQWNYTDEDRYNIRQTVNSQYWRFIYQDVMDLVEVIRLNTDPAVKDLNSAYGDNANQIACARILKVWALHLLTDTYGDIPYFQAFKGKEMPNPPYDKQEAIYADLLKELKEAAAQIVVAPEKPLVGDIIFEGDMEKWQKFANSMRLRIALRMSKRDAGKAKSVYDEIAGAGGKFMESNDDIAKFQYIGGGANSSQYYRAYFVRNRNDFTITKQLVDLLKGANDDLNGKKNPFAGISDPRLPIYTPPLADGSYNGMPYGVTDVFGKSYYPANCPSFAKNPPVMLSETYAPVYMNYAELCFIMSEINGWDQAWYEKGIKASMEEWGVAAADIDAYVAKVPKASAENVITQKYIALYMQGYQGWAEYRRTGYPLTLIHPGEITIVDTEGKNVIFEPLVGTDIPRRLTYPQQEQVLNKANYDAAKAQMGGDDLGTDVWWSK